MSNLVFVIITALFIGQSYAQEPRTAQGFNERGAQRYTRGDMGGAIADFSKVIDLTSQLNNKSSDPEASSVRALDPRTAEAYIERGKAYFSRNDVALAIEDFSAALKISPSSTAAFTARYRVPHQ